MICWALSLTTLTFSQLFMVRGTTGWSGPMFIDRHGKGHGAKTAIMSCKVSERKAIQLPSATLNKYIGKYKGIRTKALLVTSGQNFLTLRAKGKEFVIYPETETLFFSKEADITFEFININTTNIKMLVRENGQIAEEMSCIN